ncbi:MAG TPA: DUF1553 domain-containing protein [Roseimicrobium sp.]|nr:DUF1553 domain-containing protein [Roseimicrobium sp.]
MNWKLNGRPWRVILITVLAVVCLIIPRVHAAEAGRVDGKVPAKIDYNRDVRPIISSKCYHCHGPDETSRKAKLRLDQREEVVKDRKGTFAIKPGDVKQSELIARILTKDPDEIMPPPKEGHPLTAYEVGVLTKWVDQWAVYAEHWSFTKPVAVPLPEVKPRNWARNGIDRFILQRLQTAGLKPAAAADRHTLIRRMSLDITGLPPSPAEVDAFVKDTSPDAVELLVDRLLASPAYGERWARVWMDLARYADSAGYGSDPLRPNIWPYRDWIINAYNRNIPYDQFSLEQLAGDLLPSPTEDQLVATAFHRNTMTNTEGGTDDEEFRVAAVKDRVATTAQVWMGLTMGCAQCHTHKYDPISQKEYYQFYGLFNQTEDFDQPDERPTLPLPTKSDRERMERLKGELASLEKQLDTVTPELASAQAAWEKVQTIGNDWQILKEGQGLAVSGATLALQPDGSWLVSGTNAIRDTYTLQFKTGEKPVTAVRLELLPDDTLPQHGPGRGENGNAQLNDIKLSWRSPTQSSRTARFIRIEMPGTSRLLSLAEVQVFSNGKNVARGGKASQSSTDYDGAAALAIDGNTDGNYFNAKSTTHTKTEENPWWELDLGSELPLDHVVVWNRTDGGTGTRLVNFKVSALDAARKVITESTLTQPPSPSAQVDIGGDQIVKLANPTGDLASMDALAKLIDAAANTSFNVQGQGRAQTIVFETAGKVGGPDGALLNLVISQSQSATNQTLGRFRVSVTSDARPVRALPKTIQTILAVAADKRSSKQSGELATFYRGVAPQLDKVRTQIVQKRKELDGIKPVAVPVMREVSADKLRVTRLLQKGNFLMPGEPVQPGFPKAFGAPPKTAPTNRIGVAQWIFSPENPLTARVTVNRYWAQIFGTGLVETEEDFGSQGTLPTHPELLDWLAVSFQTPAGQPVPGSPGSVGLGWDMKALVKLMVMSATYQQSSYIDPKSAVKDPKNRLLSHYTRRRLDAETVRDQALALSGLLSRKIGGPSVYPPQPDGLWRAAFNGQRTYATSTGEDRYRRGMYTVWRRTIPYPSMATFDAPSRENCTLRRLPTNTPLQAFVTLNDPAFFEMAQALGRRIVKEGGETVESRVRFGLYLSLARKPKAAEVETLMNLFNAELEHYKMDGEAAKKLVADPAGITAAGLTAAEQAAWTVVGNVLLNLDGVLTRG